MGPFGRVPKNTVFKLFLSKFLNVSGARHGFELRVSQIEDLQLVEALDCQLDLRRIVVTAE